MAFPVLRDGDLVISQVANIALYIAKKYDMLPEGEANERRAHQYMLDCYEMSNTGASLIAHGFAKGEKGTGHIDQFLTKTMPMYADLAEKQIQGPFFFGEKPCYVDYFATGVIASWSETLRLIIEAGYYKHPLKRSGTKLSKIFESLYTKGDAGIDSTLPRTLPKFTLWAEIGYAASSSWYNPRGFLGSAFFHEVTNWKGGHKVYVVVTILAGLLLMGTACFKLLG